MLNGFKESKTWPSFDDNIIMQCNASGCFINFFACAQKRSQNTKV